ncbi:MAG: YchJ family protein [Kiritimatiellae bacterium]|nr:YchJ family protein [Kiritimatiellia bacterium]
MSEFCPCGSKLTFCQCCEPFLLETKKPKTPTQLMRSRYTAYAMGAVEFLYKTSSAKVKKEFDADNSRKWAESAKWTGIEILKESNGKADDTTGSVEFIAHYTVNETEFNHHEKADFEKINGEWLFMDGKIFGPEPARRSEPKVGRNEPCACGSGKKFKKCCGAQP